LHRKQLPLLSSATGASFLTLTRTSRFDFLGGISAPWRALSRSPSYDAAKERVNRMHRSYRGVLGFWFAPGMLSSKENPLAKQQRESD
jgi:hypothetical protein